MQKRITPAQEKWENSHFKENIHVETGMTNYLFQRNQQNKTKGLIQLHYVSFEALISLIKYEKRSNYTGWQKTDNKEITVFCCDLFALTAEDAGGEFDAIWDRGSLSAVQPGVGDRGKRYTKHMRSFLAANGRYMLDSLHYEIDRGNRPPASISKELRNDIYGEDFFIKELEVESIGNDPNSSAPFTMDNYCHLFTPKAN